MFVFLDGLGILNYQIINIKCICIIDCYILIAISKLKSKYEFIIFQLIFWVILSKVIRQRNILITNLQLFIANITAQHSDKVIPTLMANILISFFQAKF